MGFTAHYSVWSGFDYPSGGSGSGTTPTGTGLRHVTDGVEDGTAYTLSAADIPGADTAVAHQVPTSDGAGGFTWEDQAGGTPTTDAGDLTSGTLAAARLPGVLANVDTQGELLSAAGAAASSHTHAQSDVTNLVTDLAAEATTRDAADTALAAPQYVTLGTSATLANERVLTGTTNQIALTDNGAGGTLVLSTPQNIHTGASPTFAGETLTGALQFTGTQTSPGASVVGFYRDSGGNLHLNAASGAGFFVDTNNGTAQIGLTAGFGIEFLTNQATAGSSIYNIYRSASNTLTSNVPTGATHVATVNGARVGGFPLVPGDMPAKHRLDVQLAAQSVSTAAPTLVYGTPTVNECFTYSAGVWTCTIAGLYLIEASMYANFTDVGQIGVKKNGAQFVNGTVVAIWFTPTVVTPVQLAVGDTFEVAGYCAATRALDVSTYVRAYLRATRLN